MWSSTYCLEVTVHQILADLCPFENSLNFSFPDNSIVYVQSKWNFVNTYTMMWSSAYYFEVTLHQILPELCPIKNFHKLIYILFLANFYILHPVKVKVYLLLDHICLRWTVSLKFCVEQHTEFQAYSPPNINRVIPLWKFVSFCFWLTPTVYIQSSCGPL